ncbi:MAG TPA: hypothetical protein VNT30_14475 [Stellaceae bacterium]|nr:hypothetical protein [Stellaceae bacterium]
MAEIAILRRHAEAILKSTTILAGSPDEARQNMQRAKAHRLVPMGQGPSGKKVIS